MTETNSNSNGNHIDEHTEKTITALFWFSFAFLISTMFLLTAEAFKFALGTAADLSQWYLMIVGTYATLKRVSRWKRPENNGHCGHILVYIFWTFSGTMIVFYSFLPDTIFQMPEQMLTLTYGITGIFFGSSVFKTLNIKRNNKNHNNSDQKASP